MEIKVNKQIGGATVQFGIDEKDDDVALSLVAFLTEPDFCFLCKETKLKWEVNKAKTDTGNFTYIKRRCLNPNCRATSTMGKYKDGGYFWKNWEIYQKNAPVNIQNTNTPITDENGETIPF